MCYYKSNKSIQTNIMWNSIVHCYEANEYILINDMWVTLRGFLLFGPEEYQITSELNRLITIHFVSSYQMHSYRFLKIDNIRYIYCQGKWVEVSKSNEISIIRDTVKFYELEKKYLEKLISLKESRFLTSDFSFDDWSGLLYENHGGTIIFGTGFTKEYIERASESTYDDRLEEKINLENRIDSKSNYYRKDTPDSYVDKFMSAFKNATENGSMTEQEVVEIAVYCYLFKKNRFAEHWEVNRMVSHDDKWDCFPNMRSMNNHGDSKEIRGIQPLYFGLICKILNISGGDGERLISYKSY